jgi:hypothetical protein
MAPVELGFELFAAAFLSYQAGHIIIAGWRIAHQGQYQRALHDTETALTPLRRRVHVLLHLLATGIFLLGFLLGRSLLVDFELRWLLPVVLILALLLEELRLPNQIPDWPGTLALLEGLRKKSADPEDLFAALESLIHDLPPGSVQQATREALYRRRSRMPAEVCLEPLKRAGPGLDELVLCMRQSGWQVGPSLDMPLEQLQMRNARAWGRAIKRRLFQERARHFYLLVSSGLGGLLVALLLISSSRFDHFPVLWLVLIYAIACLALTSIMHSSWLRRALAMSALAALAWSFLPGLLPGRAITHLPEPRLEPLTINIQMEPLPDLDLPWTASTHPFDENGTRTQQQARLKRLSPEENSAWPYRRYPPQ